MVRDVMAKRPNAKAKQTQIHIKTDTNPYQREGNWLARGKRQNTPRAPLAISLPASQTFR